MGRTGRWVALLALAAGPAAGCAAKRPYAGHPLLRDGHAVRGDPGCCRPPPVPPPDPEPPPPPTRQSARPD